MDNQILRCVLNYCTRLRPEKNICIDEWILVMSKRERWLDFTWSKKKKKKKRMRRALNSVECTENSVRIGRLIALFLLRILLRLFVGWWRLRVLQSSTTCRKNVEQTMKGSNLLIGIHLGNVHLTTVAAVLISRLGWILHRRLIPIGHLRIHVGISWMSGRC